MTEYVLQDRDHCVQRYNKHLQKKWPAGEGTPLTREVNNQSTTQLIFNDLRAMNQNMRAQAILIDGGETDDNLERQQMMMNAWDNHPARVKDRQVKQLEECVLQNDYRLERLAQMTRLTQPIRSPLADLAINLFNRFFGR